MKLTAIASHVRDTWNTENLDTIAKVKKLMNSATREEFFEKRNLFAEAVLAGASGYGILALAAGTTKLSGPVIMTALKVIGGSVTLGTGGAVMGVAVLCAVSNLTVKFFNKGFEELFGKGKDNWDVFKAAVLEHMADLENRIKASRLTEGFLVRENKETGKLVLLDAIIRAEVKEFSDYRMSTNFAWCKHFKTANQRIADMEYNKDEDKHVITGYRENNERCVDLTLIKGFENGDFVLVKTHEDFLKYTYTETIYETFMQGRALESLSNKEYIELRKFLAREILALAERVNKHIDMRKASRQLTRKIAA